MTRFLNVDVIYNLESSNFSGIMGAKLDWNELKREWKETDRRLNN